MLVIKKISDALDAVSKVIASAMAISLVVITTYGVIARYVFQNPLAWQNEVSVLLFGWMIFIGVSIGFKSKEHIMLEFLLHSLPVKAAKFLNILIYLICIAFFSIVIYAGVEIAKNTWAQMYYTIDLSTAWLYLSFPVNAVVMIIHLIDLILEQIFAQPKAEV